MKGKTIIKRARNAISGNSEILMQKLPHVFEIRLSVVHKYANVGHNSY